MDLTALNNRVAEAKKALVTVDQIHPKVGSVIITIDEIPVDVLKQHVEPNTDNILFTPKLHLPYYYKIIQTQWGRIDLHSEHTQPE